MSEETWLPVVGFEGFYEVSNLGRVRNVAHRKGGHTGIGFVLKARRNVKSHYVQYRLYKTGPAGESVPFEKKGHHMVLEAFVGPCPEGMSQVNHLDGDKGNNRLENLEWCTASWNQTHKVRVLGKDPIGCSDQNGEKNRKAKLTEEQIRELRCLSAETNLSQRELADRFGIGQANVSMILLGRTWKHVV